MQIAVTSEQMRQMDQITIQNYGIPGIVLMENAGRAVADVILHEYSPGVQILVFCGKGNNGGDGFVVARYLINNNFAVRVFLAGKVTDLKGDAKYNYTILQNMHVPVHSIQTQKDLKSLPLEGVIVDGLLGTGITGAVRGIYTDLIAWINNSGLPVVSVDCPSGLNCDTGTFEPVCVQADLTVTMGEIKQGLLLSPGNVQTGDLEVADIGFPKTIYQDVPTHTFVLDAWTVANMLPLRPINGHKGDFGKIFLLAGSRGLTGAAALASMASLRAGAGLSVLGIPESINPILEEKLTEVMTKPFSDNGDGTLSFEAFEAIEDFLPWADALAIGPGLSGNPHTAELIRKLVPNLTYPTVLDADGINAFEGHMQLLQESSFKGIITPHPGELSRLTGLSIHEIEKDRIRIVRETAQKLGCVLVLKGGPTIIGIPDGNVYINTTGNSGMGTAGTGDVLTGIIGGLLAQGLSATHAALCGVFIHGLAGDIAAEVSGERSLIASDLLESLGAAFQSLEEMI